jgi:hypothetical protein
MTLNQNIDLMNIAQWNELTDTASLLTKNTKKNNESIPISHPETNRIYIK